MTLMEVVAGIALMGAVLTSTLVAHSAHVRQRQRADWKIQATNHLEALIADRLKGGQWFELGEKGLLMTNPAVRWQVVKSSKSGAEAVGCELIGLRAEIDANGRREPIAQIDLLIGGEDAR